MSFESVLDVVVFAENKTLSHLQNYSDRTNVKILLVLHIPQFVIFIYLQQTHFKYFLQLIRTFIVENLMLLPTALSN